MHEIQLLIDGKVVIKGRGTTEKTNLIQRVVEALVEVQEEVPLDEQAWNEGWAGQEVSFSLD